MTTLRLSSSSSPTTAEQYVEQIVQETCMSLPQKTGCLKTLSVILKNAVDPAKGGNAADPEASLKYRTLKRDNPKLKERLFCFPSMERLLEDVGFTTQGGVFAMAQAPSAIATTRINAGLLPVIATAQTKLDNNVSSNKKPKIEQDPLEKLSEKQKARRLLEQKQQQDKEKARQARALTRAQIAADKKVRLEDENWRPSVSAAADKTGTGLSTFRDRYGE